jgi:peptide/nickel transport system substrate-binding protein
MISFSKSALAIIAAAGLGGAMAAAPVQAQTLKVVMHSDVKILDPIWTTAYIQRNHGYMVWDTLFAMDEKFDVKPQMVDKYDVSADKLVWTFTLRDGLEWHNGKPVTAEDCVASIKRWAARDSMGQKMMASAEGLEVVDAKTFKLKMKEPYGLVLQSLGKPSSNVPFMMPKRVAETDPNKQIEEFVGSGPFVFKRDEWQPGSKLVYTKFEGYKPRSEPPSGTTGGKVVKVDRVEWRPIRDHQQAVNALLAGEIDYIEAPPHDLHPLIKKSKDVYMFNWNPLGNQFTLRFNVLHKPFDNPKIRQAVFYALNQEDFLKAVVGDEEYYKVCKAMFICGTPFETSAGFEDKLESNFKKARELLAEAKYDGTPVVLMHSTDLQVLTNLAPVAKSLMERAGFKVDMQSMDWQTVVARRAKKDPPEAGGWHAFLTSWVAGDLLNPVMAGFLNAGCDKAMFGWPCDEQIEKLRDDFARETDSAKQKAIVEALQKRVAEYPTHVHLGQWYNYGAQRNNVKGIVAAPAPVLWNITVD